MRTLRNAQRIAQKSGRIIGPTVGPLFALAGVKVSQSLDLGIEAVLLMGFSGGILGLALWVTLNKLHRLESKLDMATTDPFGLQYQQREWWEEQNTRPPISSSPYAYVQDDSDEDKT